MPDAFQRRWVALNLKPRTKEIQCVHRTIRRDDAVPNQQYNGHYLTPVFLRS